MRAKKRAKAAPPVPPAITKSKFPTPRQLAAGVIFILLKSFLFHFGNFLINFICFIVDNRRKLE